MNLRVVNYLMKFDIRPIIFMAGKVPSMRLSTLSIATVRERRNGHVYHECLVPYFFHKKDLKGDQRFP